MKNKTLFRYFLSIALLLAAPLALAQAEARYSLGAKLDFSTWEGKNPNSTDFEAKTPMLGLEAKTHYANWFGGLTLAGGEFTFDTLAPARPTNPLPTGSEPVTIKRGEVDLVLGYRFWPRIALFLDFKNVSNKWNNDGYKTEYNGLGLGVSGHHPLSPKWILFGNFGVVPMSIKADSQDVGNATRSALNIGFLYRINQRANVSISLQSQTQIDDYDNGLEQTHRVNALTFGINTAL